MFQRLGIVSGYPDMMVRSSPEELLRYGWREGSMHCNRKAGAATNVVFPGMDRQTYAWKVAFPVPI